MQSLLPLLPTLLRKSCLLFITTLFLFAGFATSVHAESTSVAIYLFYGEGCPHCEKEQAFLEQVTQQYGDAVSIFKYETYYNPTNAKLFSAATKHLGIAVGGVPLTIIGDEPLIGYGSDQTSGAAIIARIDFCLENTCPDTVASVIKPKAPVAPQEPPAAETVTEAPSDTAVELIDDEALQATPHKPPSTITLPLFGEINPVDFSLPLLTVIIAFMDGFNPCALWILIFLITMLIRMQDRKKLYLLGSTFIATSAAVYFVFLAAWFNFFQFVGYVHWIKVAIGLVALVTGALHLRESLKKSQTCHVTNASQRKTIMDRIQKITQENNLWLALAGMVVLAVSVNFIEVVCSAGLPAVYTSLLASADVSPTQYYLYLLLYTIIFMLDDLLIFFIAVKSFQATGITNNYAKYSGLVGGAIMILIGILLIFKPDALML